jgi:hypothetical protein
MSERQMWWKLDGHTPVPATDKEGVLLFGSKDERRVASTHVGEVWVSTVFLSYDHNLPGFGPPILFETMVFGGEHDQEMDRYETWEQAEAGHAEWVRRLEQEVSA